MVFFFDNCNESFILGFSIKGARPEGILLAKFVSKDVCTTLRSMHAIFG
jgi:hypothetical protein